MEALLKNNKSQFLDIFTTVSGHKSNLVSLNSWWDKVALVGKINSLNVPQSLLSNMLETKAEFSELQEILIENLLSENMQQCGVKNQAVAQTLIDIPVRNLFERTADVGFLATDADILAFLSDSTDHVPDTSAIVKRLTEYAAKYSVYDDIMLFDETGQLKAQMDTGADISGDDPVIAEVLTGEHEYLEICRYSPLRPAFPLSSLFLAPVKDPETQRVTGVLCMSFKLEGEMRSLFADLDDGSGAIMALLDKQGNTLVSADETVLPRGTALNVSRSNQIITLGKHEYYWTVARTRGYQGYAGLGWQGCVLLPFASMSAHSENSDENSDDVQRWQGFSPALSNIRHKAKIVTEDLDLVVLNGRIAAARSDADEFIPILEEIRQIGRQMQTIFTDSVSQLMNTALNTHYDGLIFQAALAIDIMDRNLYERANDCRWWALTGLFQSVLNKRQISPDDAAAMAGVLGYINDLYTVYTGLYIYDRNGKIVAVSRPAMKALEGTTVHADTGAGQVFNLKSSQQFCVSEFVPCHYYEDKYTYIYNAAIANDGQVNGGIGLVFDSGPEFKQMLEDVTGGENDGIFGLYTDRNGHVISATDNANWKTGDRITLPDTISKGGNGHKGAGIHEINGEEYILAFAVSKGYREYKTSDGYHNDVIAIIGEPNQPVKSQQ